MRAMGAFGYEGTGLVCESDGTFSFSRELGDILYKFGSWSISNMDGATRVLSKLVNVKTDGTHNGRASSFCETGSCKV